MKNFFTLIFFSLLVCSISKAENETELANSIAEVCNWNDGEDYTDEKEDCMLYYTNCVIGKGGKWTDKVLFKCVKEKDSERNGKKG